MVQYVGQPMIWFFTRNTAQIDVEVGVSSTLTGTTGRRLLRRIRAWRSHEPAEAGSPRAQRKLMRRVGAIRPWHVWRAGEATPAVSASKALPASGLRPPEGRGAPRCDIWTLTSGSSFHFWLRLRLRLWAVDDLPRILYPATVPLTHYPAANSQVNHPKSSKSVAAQYA